MKGRRTIWMRGGYALPNRRHWTRPARNGHIPPGATSSSRAPSISRSSRRALRTDPKHMSLADIHPTLYALGAPLRIPPLKIRPRRTNTRRAAPTTTVPSASSRTIATSRSRAGVEVHSTPSLVDGRASPLLAPGAALEVHPIRQTVLTARFI
ncbi:hypothetical protein C8R44DRAFT_990655 [Mycena epipterygia]|nr:hypothetical protein C8R44DRAFT_990655 [Mycena epipterygia]